MARKTKAQKAAEAEVERVARVERAAAAKQERIRNEQLGLARELDAFLWEHIDKFSSLLFNLMTGRADDIASYRVRGRVPTAVMVCYDDGYTYYVERRLGGLQTRPVILEFEHSDPAHVGTVTSAIRFRTGGGPSAYEDLYGYIAELEARLEPYVQREAGNERCEAHEDWLPIEDMHLTEDGAWLCQESWDELVAESN